MESSIVTGPCSSRGMENLNWFSARIPTTPCHWKIIQDPWLDEVVVALRFAPRYDWNPWWKGNKLAWFETCGCVVQYPGQRRLFCNNQPKVFRVEQIHRTTNRQFPRCLQVTPPEHQCDFARNGALYGQDYITDRCWEMITKSLDSAFTKLIQKWLKTIKQPLTCWIKEDDVAIDAYCIGTIGLFRCEIRRKFMEWSHPEGNNIRIIKFIQYQMPTMSVTQPENTKENWSWRHSTTVILADPPQGLDRALSPRMSWSHCRRLM